LRFFCIGDRFTGSKIGFYTPSNNILFEVFCTDYFSLARRVWSSVAKVLNTLEA
jgi:hypothetical protein